MSIIRILYVITTLDPGGAERCLQQTLQNLPQNRYQVLVLCLKDIGKVGLELQAEGFQIVELGLRIRSFSIKVLLKTLQEIVCFRPHIIHAWMYHGIALSFIIKLSSLKSPWIWSIHNKDVSPRGCSRKTRLLVHFLSSLSRWADLIIYNAQGSRDSHEHIGYRQTKGTVLYNGYDLNKGAILTPAEKNEQRLKLKWPKNKKIVGYISRYHPQKDVLTFLRTAQHLLSLRQDVHFFCCGKGLDPSHKLWWNLVQAHGLDQHLHCQEYIYPVESWLNFFDVLTLSSVEESLPNVLGEAMVCGIPWASTDAGDAKHLLIPPCSIVETENDKGLALALLKILERDSETQKNDAELLRHHVEQHFNLITQQDQLHKLYENSYSKLLGSMSKNS